MQDNLVELDLDELDGHDTGREFTGSDYVWLGILGIVIPAILLVVGLL